MRNRKHGTESKALDNGLPAADRSNAELVRRTFYRLWSGDLDALREICTHETVCRFPARTLRGGEEITAYFEETLAALPDMNMELLAISGESDNVLIRWRMTGTHMSDFGGIAPTGKAIELDGFEHFVFRGGKLVSVFVVSDQMQFARQIGMMPPDGSFPDRVMKFMFKVRTKLAGALER